MSTRYVSLEEQLNHPTNQPQEAMEGERHPSLVGPPVIATDFAELEDGSIIEMIEDPDVPSQTAFAVYQDGNVHYEHEVKTNKAIYVPLRRDSEIVRNVRLPRGAEPYGSVESLVDQMCAIFQQCAELDPIYIFLLANFVLSTWVVDRLIVAPYVAFTGLSGSGKTTVLRILNLLCRRAILTADITPPAFYRICDRLMPTVLIDELDGVDQRRSLFRLLRVSSTPGFVVLRKDQSFKMYGARVVSWTELPNDPALNNRCIVVPMRETKRALVTTENSEIQKATDHLTKQLLQYRLDNLNTLTLPHIEGSDGLNGHTLDLFRALGQANGHPFMCKELLKDLELLQNTNREPLSPDKTAVLQTLFWLVHTSEHYRFPRQFGRPPTVADLAGHVNHSLESSHERFRVSPRKVGAILALFHINHVRTRWGYRVLLDRRDAEHIHDLVYRYGLDNSLDREHPGDRSSNYGLLIPLTAYKTCEFCQVLDRRQKLPLKADVASKGIDASAFHPG